MLTIGLFLLITANGTANSDVARVQKVYEETYARQLVPMTSQLVQFPTYVDNAEAHAEQKAWLFKTAKELGFEARDAGKVTEIELPGPENAPVLGLVIHGDVQRADAEAWSVPPFAGLVVDGYVTGRGSADDKGPLAQALLTMKALADSGIARTHTIRLLVGSEEESSAGEMAEYLKDHQPPDYSLVLDSEFPVVVGEKAWDGLALSVAFGSEREGVTKPWRVVKMDAGLSPSIVPDHAEIHLEWKGERVNWDPLIEELGAVKLPEGTRIVAGLGPKASILRVVAYGKSAHSGVNLSGGRNALIALARALEGKLPTGGADDLFAFIRMAGKDLHGSGLGITDEHPIWGRYGLNVATIKTLEKDENQVVLMINLRRIPPRTGPQLKAYLYDVVAKFNAKQGSSLTPNGEAEWFQDEPLGFDVNAPIVKRLMNVYAAATGERARPAISGGGTYAKRLPNAIAFGMWFPGKPYPGHDVDEKISIGDLQRGARVLIHALVDIATKPKIENAFGKK
ncbi:MAG TPA: M20/M25/M40 family metallo-hydrolase [Thermoanaerobaculia bacterium]